MYSSVVVSLAVYLLAPAGAMRAQEVQRADLRKMANPLARNPAAVEAGRAHYGERCAGCHGHDGRGAEGPSLYRSRVVARGAAGELFEILKYGIPGTEMVPVGLSDEQLWQIVSYVHSIARPGLQPPVPGDPEAGRRIFQQADCSGCHMVRGKGGVLGPDLSSLALERTSEAIRNALLQPGASVATGYKAVTVSTAKGETITGVVKNEDNFTIQLMKTNGEFALFLRNELREVVYKPESLMPRDYSRRLSPEQLQNLLAYLDRLRAPVMKFEVHWLNY